MLLIKLVYICHFSLLYLYLVKSNLILFIFQFLTELDGVEILTGVFVFAATRLVSQACIHLSKNKQ